MSWNSFKVEVGYLRRPVFGRSGLILLSVISLGVIAISAGCGRQKSDLRSMAPAESLAYLEADDLGKALRTITENDTFRKQSHSPVDTGNFDGVQVAITVTGFETSEKDVTGNQAILNLRPKFTLIAETNAWSWQVRAIVERSLDGFVRRTYGRDAGLEHVKKDGDEWYVWSGEDGRKAFAVISGTNIFFGNDEESVEKCITAKKGTADSLLDNEDLEQMRQESGDSLAFGFVSKDGVKKIADVVGISVAVEKSDSEDGRSIISRILPQLLKNGVEGITWTARPGKLGIDERIVIKTDGETADILKETIKPHKTANTNFFDFVPFEARSVTRYSLKSPQVAFRSLFLVAAGKAGPIEGKLIGAFSNSLLSQYGIANAEEFLSAVGSEILTAQLDEDGDESFAVVRISDLDKIQNTLSAMIDFSSGPKGLAGAKVWVSDDSSYSAAVIDNYLILGEATSVKKALQIGNKRKISPIDPKFDFTKSKIFERLRTSGSASTTISRDYETVKSLARVLAKPRNSDRMVNSMSVAETRFTSRGIERHYVSEFGLVGTIVSQFDSE